MPLAIATRFFGRRGQAVTQVGLGGEGVLRTSGRTSEAFAVIEEARVQGGSPTLTRPEPMQAARAIMALSGEGISIFGRKSSRRANQPVGTRQEPWLILSIA